MPGVDWKHVQGPILSAYGDHTYAAYILLEITDPAAARTWISHLLEGGMVADAESVMNSEMELRRRRGLRGEEMAAGDGAQKPESCLVNLAFTADGLSRLGLQAEAVERFPTEFQEGMDRTTRRANMLGDVRRNHSRNWEWGQRKFQPHVLLMVFSADSGELEKEHVWRRLKIPDSVRLSRSGTAGTDASDAPFIRSYLSQDKTEHFGFKDGISQPHIEGSPSAAKRAGTSDEISVVKPGEFILGFPNERNLLPPSPTVSPVFDVNNDLPELNGRRDFGRYGTFMVVRQLEQDVANFENFIRRTASSGQVPSAEWLAARIVGRWKSGAPLVRYPAFDPADKQELGTHHDPDDNRFLYHYEDRYGLKCPIGAHIRRANPRDSLDPDPQIALRLSKRRRILRRGRLYGDKFDAHRVGAGPLEHDGRKRGLLFVCLNADTSDQFELVQHSWLNNRHFAGLYDERDPMLGNGYSLTDAMSIQTVPANQKIEGLHSFVRMRGGAYFFMPGMPALRCLASCGRSRPAC